MKLTKLMLSAFVAALALVSCQKEEGPSVNGEYKSVEIEIGNIFMTKSAGDAIAEGTPVVLNNFRIYLTDGNTFYFDATDENGNIYGVDDYKFTTNQRSLNFHFVNPSVNKVVAVANLTDAQYASITDYASLQAFKLDIANQQNPDGLALFAEDALEPAGYQHPPVDNGGTHNNLQTNVYKAILNFVPRVARFELDGFAVNFKAGAAALYNKISIHQVAFNNYYSEVALSTGYVDGTKLVDCQAENSASAVAYLTGNTGSEWYSDKQTLDFVRPSAMTADTWIEGELGTTFYYHFFPIESATPEHPGYPELMFQLSTEDTEGASSSTYIYTKSFKEVNGASSTVINNFEEGKIYRMKFVTTGETDNGDGDVPIDEGDIEKLGRCLDIVVTVEDWNVILVTPEF